MALNWTGVISKGILKLKLAFDSSVSVSERESQLRDYAKSFSDNNNITVIETQHYSDGSFIEAQINQ